MDKRDVDDGDGVRGLTHVGPDGRARMVDVSQKPETLRLARAEAFVRMSPSTAMAIKEASLKKGDVREVSRLAGVMAAKRVGDLIPLCHPLALEHVDVEITIGGDHVHVETRAQTTGRTGVEMEALTAASVAALTIYDMAKSMDREMTIEGLRLLEKRGGSSGPWTAPDNADS